VDRPEVSETFSDSIGEINFDGIVFKICLTVNRMDPPRPPEPPTTSQVTAARLVLPIPTAMNLVENLSNMIKVLQEQGHIKAISPGPGTVQ
jgi:hypothetical protein